MKTIRALALSLFVCLCAHAQNAALLPQPRAQFLDSNGAPLAGGLVYTYAAGTTTPQATYTTAAGNVANTNPVVLDAGGFASIWISNSLAYKIVVQTSLGVTISTTDNVTAAGGALLGTSGASLINYVPSGTGALTRSVAAVLADTVRASDFSGADAGAKIQACLNALGSNGTCDARMLTGAQTISSSVTFPGNGLTLLLGNATFTGPAAGSTFKLWTGTEPASVTYSAGSLPGSYATCTGCSILGVGVGTTVLKTNGAVTPTYSSRSNAIELNSPYDQTGARQADHITIRDLTLDGNKANVTMPACGASCDVGHSGIFSQGTNNSTLTNVEAKNYWYGGLEFGQYSNYNTFTNLLTSNDGAPSLSSYGGLLIQGSSTHITVVNHVDVGSVQGLWMIENVRYNHIQGTYRNNTLHGIVVGDDQGNKGYGNEVHAVIEGSTSQCASVGATNTQTTEGSSYFLTVRGCGDMGVVVSPDTRNSYFNIVTSNNATDGIWINGATDNRFDVVAANNSTGSLGSSCGVRVSNSAARNRINLQEFDNQATPEIAACMAAGSIDNELDANIYPGTSSVQDGGTTNKIRVSKPGGIADWISGTARFFGGLRTVGNSGTPFAQYLNGTDANPTFAMTQNGSLQWGAGGASAVDTTLFRNGAGQLGLVGGMIPQNATGQAFGGSSNRWEGFFQTLNAAGTVTLPSIPSLTGTRYLCISTTGVVTSSASACSGT